MVGDDAEGAGGFIVAAVFLAAKLADLLEDIGEEVGFIDALFAVEHADGALQAHAGIHILLGQRLKGAVGLFVVLHEHVVPDLQIPAAGAGGRAVRAAGLLVGDDEHLGIRAAGAGDARRAPPVVFLGQEEDVIIRHAAPAPQLGAFLVAGAVRITREHREGQTVLGQAQVFRAGEEFPAPGNHLLLEIVAQRPVAQHLKEGEVAEIAHVVNIAGAHALLHVRQAVAGGVLRAHQIGHQRMHARGGEQHRGVVFGNHRRAGNHGMAVALEKLQEHRAQFGGMIGLHQWSLLLAKCGWWRLYRKAARAAHTQAFPIIEETPGGVNKAREGTGDFRRIDKDAATW